MLIRRSTLSFVVFGAAVFLFGSGFVIYRRPEYLSSDYLPSIPIPDKWRDWGGLHSGDRPLPANGADHSHSDGKKVKPGFGKPSPNDDPTNDGEVHILPIDVPDVEVKPLPISKQTKPRPININSSKDLQNRLRAFLGAPMPTYRQFIQDSLSECPFEVADRQVNPDQHKGNLETWTTMENDDLSLRRIALVRYFEELEKDGVSLVGKKADFSQRRGIVMTGGNQDTTERLLVTLRILRHEYECSLPVEIFGFPNEITDPDVLEELKDLNAEVKELAGREHLNIWKNFQIKAEAIVKSSFEEVLYLDSDNVPLRDPSYLFDAELYAGKGQPGIVLWPDLNKDHPDNPIWRLTGKKCNYSEWEVESGQILVNKLGNDGMNLAALRVAMHMQLDHEFYFSLSGGDKDTFRYAFWVLQLPYSVSPTWVSALGFYNAYDNGRFCGIAMLQYDINPPEPPQTHPLPLFVHANLLKHLADGVIPSSPFQIIKRPSIDTADSRALDKVRAFVYNNFGMCTDFEIMEDVHAPKEGKNGNGKGAGPVLDVEIMDETFEEVYGGIFQGWTRNVYSKYGGKKGGW